MTFNPHYLFGFPLGEQGLEPPTDWNEYGFASQAYLEIFQELLEMAEQENVKMNFMLGGSQGQGVPAPIMSRGLAVHLLAGNASVAGGETYDDQVPPPTPLSDQLKHGHFYQQPIEEFGQPNLTATIALEVLDSSVTDGIRTLRIEEETIVDLTNQVSDGRLRWTAPDGNSTWRIMTFWEHFTNQRSVTGGVNATSVIANGSWVVDHFSQEGARLLSDFVDQEIFSHGEIGDLVTKLGSIGLEDSLEISAALWWSHNFLDAFERAKGYSLVKYLPLLFTRHNQFRQEFYSYDEDYVYGPFTSENVSLHTLDYISILTDGYVEFLSTLTEWSHSVGMQYSAQPAYNLPLDMSASIPHVDIPETETLAFLDQVDKYRRFTGPAHVSGKRIISSELGAVLGEYTQTMSNMVWQMKRSWAAGVNELNIHGLQYTGDYAITTWPGIQSLFYAAGENFGLLQPCWQHMKDVLDFAARTNFFLRQGTAKVDLVVYAHEPVFKQGKVNDQTAIIDRGYTYDYLGPANFQLAAARVDDDVLAADGPGYRALVFVNETGISSAAAEKILSYAQSGLPIFVVGELPMSAISAVGDEQDRVTRAMEQLTEQRSVAVVRDHAELVTALERADVLPRASLHCSGGPVYTNWRQDEDSGDDFVYIFNDQDDDTSCELTFTTTSRDRTPYFLDAWTGRVALMTDYYRPGSNQVSTTMRLVANEMKLLQFSSPSESDGDIDTDPEALFSYADPDANVVQTATNITSPQDLNIWNVTIESWHGPDGPPGPFTVRTEKTNFTFQESPLERWASLNESLAGVSGVGFYSTHFSCPREAREAERPGAFLTLPPIEHTARAMLNGVSLPPLDFSKPRVDLTDYLQCGEGEGGENILEVVVTTNLFNAVKAYTDHALFMGLTADDMGAEFDTADFVEVGLLGPVQVTWVEWESSDLPKAETGGSRKVAVEGLAWLCVVGVGLFLGV